MEKSSATPDYRASGISPYTFTHKLNRDQFVINDILEGICGHEGAGCYNGLIDRVDCPECIRIYKEQGDA